MKNRITPAMPPTLPSPTTYPPYSYDTALPQPWVDLMIRQGFDPRGVVVWAYPPESLFGIPWPLSPATAHKILVRSRSPASLIANWH